MRINETILFIIMPCVATIAACHSTPTATPKIETITTKTSDGVTIFGETYFGELGGDTPLVLLFHQGGSNGRGEYSSIASWLNAEGFRAIAWDQRSGGATYGDKNRTIKTLPENIVVSYCDAYADLQGALDYVVNNNLSNDIIVWGSSYSGALVFQLAAKNPESVAGVIAFSPAAGGPMVDCRARLWVSQVDDPIFVLKPESEMVRESSVEQRDILMAAGVKFEVVQNGLHGSSMLVDDRTDNDMSLARNAVRNWLKAALSKNSG